MAVPAVVAAAAAAAAAAALAVSRFPIKDGRPAFFSTSSAPRWHRKEPNHLLSGLRPERDH